MTKGKKTEEDSKVGGDDIRKQFMMVKREGTLFLKVGRALGGGKRASKIPIDVLGAHFLGTNNDKYDPRFQGPSQSIK